MNTQYAFLDKDRIPNREQWQKSIADCGFDFEIDPELKPFEDSGFLPCKLAGKESGFEIYYDTSPEFLSQFSSIAPAATSCIYFCWGGDMSECACAMIVSYSLAKDFGAIVSYEGDAPYQDLEVFYQETEGAVAEAQK